MSPENQSEPLRWVDQLDALENIPGDVPQDKSKTWDRLYARLRNKPAKRSRMTYWSAAACLVLILGATWLFKINSREEVITKIPAKKESPAVHPKMHGKADQIAPVVPMVNHAAKSVKRKQLPRSSEVTDINPPAVIPPEEMAIAEESTNDTPLQADTVMMLADVPVKKKLRVVHINELEKRRDDEISYTGKANNFSLNRSDPHSTDKAFVVSRKAADDILKIKLSPSN